MNKYVSTEKYGNNIMCSTSGACLILFLHFDKLCESVSVNVSLLFTFYTVVGHISEIDGKRVYDVVRPIRLHDLQKRDLKVSSLSLSLSLSILCILF